MTTFAKLEAVTMAAVLVLISCDNPTVSPDRVFTPSFDQGGQGVGAEFIDNPFIGAFFVDFDGDFCSVILEPPLDDVNDFIRTNPNGKRFLHWAEHPALMTFITAGGELFQGIGTTTLNSGYVGGSLITDPIIGVGSARVTNAAGVTKQAVCKITTNAKGDFKVLENALH